MRWGVVGLVAAVFSFAEHWAVPAPLIHKRKQTQTQTTQLHSSPKQFIHQLSFSCGASGSWLDLNWLVGAARLSSLLASCLGAGPPIQTHQKRIQLGCLFSAPRFIEEFHVDWCCCSLFLCGAVRQLPPLTHKEKNNPINTHSSYAAWGPLLFNSSFFFIPLILKERKWKEKKRVDWAGRAKHLINSKSISISSILQISSIFVCFFLIKYFTPYCYNIFSFHKWNENKNQ